MPMREEEILKTIRALSCSQGYYGRMLLAIERAKVEDPHGYRDWMDEMELQGFESPLDLVLFLES